MRFLRFFLFVLPLIASLSARAQEQVLHYKVDYALGPIHKTAAHACVHMRTDGDRFFATLNGNSINWGGRIYAVRDTLSARMTPVSSFPGVSEQILYQTGWYFKPHTAQWLAGDCFNGPSDYRNTHGQGTLDASDETMEAVKITADMLSLFYLFRHIDFGVLKQGGTFELTSSVPGGAQRTVAVTYCGPDTYDIDGTEYNTYALEFEFWYCGAPSGYRVRCQVGRGSRIPLEFAADLKIGRLAMIYDI